MKRSVPAVAARPLIPPHARLLAFTEVWAHVLIPKIIIQSTFVALDKAERRCSESLDMAEPDRKRRPFFEERHMWYGGISGREALHIILPNGAKSSAQLHIPPFCLVLAAPVARQVPDGRET